MSHFHAIFFDHSVTINTNDKHFLWWDQAEKLHITSIENCILLCQSQQYMTISINFLFSSIRNYFPSSKSTVFLFCFYSYSHEVVHHQLKNIVMKKNKPKSLLKGSVWQYRLKSWIGWEEFVEKLFCNRTLMAECAHVPNTVGHHANLLDLFLTNVPLLSTDLCHD